MGEDQVVLIQLIEGMLLMETRACVLYAQEDVRIETREIGEVGPQQVLVRVGAGGVCGSDIHYYWDGGIGTIRVTEPIIMDGVYTWVLSMVSPVAASWYPSSVAVSATLHSLRMAPMEA